MNCGGRCWWWHRPRQSKRRYATAFARPCGLKIRPGSPLWTRHDRAGQPGALLTSHAFAKNLKGYAEEAGLKGIHVHQTRHTYARIAAEETGSLTETQDALGHRNLATTRVYVRRIAVKRDKHGRSVLSRAGAK